MVRLYKLAIFIKNKIIWVIDRVVSVSTGHQVAEERQNRRLYLQDRQGKLDAQWARNSKSNGIFQSVCVYLSGYLNGTTDIEIKRVIAEGGGQTV